LASLSASRLLGLRSHEPITCQRFPERHQLPFHGPSLRVCKPHRCRILLILPPRDLDTVTSVAVLTNYDLRVKQNKAFVMPLAMIAQTYRCHHAL
ncbi:hypothetical protein KCU62_g455, partial [Aureobasidium sp. EXF-3399]